MEDKNYVAVVGALNIDITGTSDSPLVSMDSNPGRVTISFGGVGRNIAENICRLGLRVELVSVLGNDFYGLGLRKNCEELGIGLDAAFTASGENTSTYLCINNSDGDMEVAVNDMSVYRLITPEFLAERIDFINQSRLVVVDTNLPEEAICYLSENLKVPIIADPVSTKKASKLLQVLPFLDTIKPNRYEAEVLSGISIKNDADVKQAAKILVDKGVGNVFISMGGQGVYYKNGKTQGKCQCFPGTVVNTTGCGDAFVAAVTWARVMGMEIGQAALAGMAASAICAAAKGTISDELSEANLRQKINQSIENGPKIGGNYEFR